MNDFYANRVTLIKIGFTPMRNLSRYLIKGGLIMNIKRMKLLKKRPDGRYAVIDDQGVRRPYNLARLRGFKC